MVATCHEREEKHSALPIQNKRRPNLQVSQLSIVSENIRGQLLQLVVV